MGRIYLDQGYFDKALKLYKNGELIEATNREAYIAEWWANYYHLSHNYKKAISFYEKAIELNYKKEVHSENLSNIYFEIGDFARGLESLFKSIEYEPNEIYYYYLMTKAYRLQNKYNAEFILEKLKEIEKNNRHLKKVKNFQDYIAYFAEKENQEIQIDKWLENDLERIVQFCMKNNIDIIIQNYPYPYYSANKLLKKVANKYSLLFVDNYKHFKSLENYNSYFHDSDHLTDEGHRIMARNVHRVLIDKNRKNGKKGIN